MSLALVINAGQVERVGATTANEPLLVQEMSGGGNTDGGIDTDAAGVLGIADGAGTAAPNATSVQIGTGGTGLPVTIGAGGSGGSLTTIAGDLTVSGVEIIVSGSTIQGPMQIGDTVTAGSEDTLDLSCVIENSALWVAALPGNPPVSMVFDGTQDHIIAVESGAYISSGAAGKTLAIAAAAGDDEFAGGQINIEGGAGGAAGVGAGQAGGLCESSGGDGGAGTAVLASGIGGLGRFEGGDAGAANGGAGNNGGNCEIQGGLGTGSGIDGQVLIGTAQTSSITIGTSGVPTTIWASGVITATTGYDLNATANGTSGSEAVGVYTGGFVNISPATDDLQTVLEALDAAVVGGPTPSLSDVIISAGTPDNNVDLSTVIAASPVILSDGASASANAVLTVSRTGITTSGPGISVTMGPGSEAVTGIGLSLVSGTGATNKLAFINHLGSAESAFTVQDGGNDVLDISGAGLVTVTPTSGQDFAVTVAGVGQMTLTSAASLNPLLLLTQATEARATAGDFAEAIGFVSTGTDAAGFSILFGVDNPNSATAVNAGDIGSLFVDTVTPALWQKTAASTWTQFSAGGATPSLSDVIISAGTPDNNVDLSTVIAANPVIFSDGGSTSATAVMEIVRSGITTSGPGLLVTMGAATATTGPGISVSVGATATGPGITMTNQGSGDSVVINNAGTGAALTVQDGGSPVLDISAAGAVLVTPTSGQNATMTAAGAGGLYMNTVEGSIQLTQSSVAASAPGDSGFQSTNNNASGTSGNILFGTAATGGGTVGSFVVRVGTVQATAGNPGNVEVYASDTFTAQAVTVTQQASTGGATFEATVGGTSTAGNWTGGSKRTGTGASGNAGTVTLESRTDATTGTSGTGNVLIQSYAPSQTSGTGPTGDITIRTGTPAGLSSAVGDILMYTEVGANGTAGNASILIQSNVGGGGPSTPAVAGILINSTGAELRMDSGTMDLNPSGAFTLDTAAGFSIDAGTASNVSVTTGDLTVSTITNGTLAVTSAGILDLDGTSVTIDSSGAISIDAASSSNISLSGAAAVLTLASTAADGDVTITAGATSGEISFTAGGGGELFNQDNFTVGGTTVTGRTLDTSFTAASVIGAINELRLGSESVLAVSKVASENIQAGAPVAMHDSTGPKIREGDATTADGRDVLIGIAPVAISSAATGLVVTAGEVAVPDAAWAAAEGGVPTTANVGAICFLATEVGHLALNAPTGGSNTVVKVGVITVGGTGAVKVLIKPFDTIKL